MAMTDGGSPKKWRIKWTMQTGIVIYRDYRDSKCMGLRVTILRTLISCSLWWGPPPYGSEHIAKPQKHSEN